MMNKAKVYVVQSHSGHGEDSCVEGVFSSKQAVIDNFGEIPIVKYTGSCFDEEFSGDSGYYVGCLVYELDKDYRGCYGNEE